MIGAAIGQWVGALRVTEGQLDEPLAGVRVHAALSGIHDLVRVSRLYTHPTSRPRSARWRCSTRIDGVREVNVPASHGVLSDVLTRSCSVLENVLRLEAFLGDAGYLPQWNEVFVSAWPTYRPARTSIVVGFAVPAVLIELQAIATTAGSTGDDRPTTPPGGRARCRAGWWASSPGDQFGCGVDQGGSRH